MAHFIPLTERRNNLPDKNIMLSFLLLIDPLSHLLPIKPSHFVQPLAMLFLVAAWDMSLIHELLNKTN